jgi:hypothetical protein
VNEDLTAPSIVVVKRSGVPLSPAAEHLLDLMKRAAGNLEAPPASPAVRGRANAKPAVQGRAKKNGARR